MKRDENEAAGEPARGLDVWEQEVEEAIQAMSDPQDGAGRGASDHLGQNIWKWGENRGKSIEIGGVSSFSGPKCSTYPNTLFVVDPFVPYHIILYSMLFDYILSYGIVFPQYNPIL